MISPALRAKRDAFTYWEEHEPNAVCEIPRKLEATANGSQGVSRKGRFWRASKRSNLRDDIAKVCTPAIRRLGLTPPVYVRIVRVAPHRLDDDNAQLAGKPVADSVAKIFGVDDKDFERFVSHVDQEKRGVREYAIRVEIFRP